MIYIFALLFFPFILYATYTEYDIAKEIQKASVKSGIDKRIFYTIAKIESGFTPLILVFTSKNKTYSFNNLQQYTKSNTDSTILPTY